MNQIVILFVCCWISFTTSSYLNAAYYYPQHIPVLDHSGVPIDTPEVQVARKQHLAAVADAKYRNAKASAGAYYSHKPSYPEVLAYAPAAPLAHYPAIEKLYLKEHVALTADGVPVDTADVQHAKAVHFKAHAQANARNAYGYGPHYIHKRSVYAYSAPQHIPVIGPNGVPVETPEVQHAKAAHFAAVAEAKARAAHSEPEHGPIYLKAYEPHSENAHSVALATVSHAAPAPAPIHGSSISYNTVHSYPISHAQPLYAPAPAYHKVIHAPQVLHIGADGVPADTPEVQHAKAAHFAAVAEAKARNAKSEHVLSYSPSASHW